MNNEATLAILLKKAKEEIATPAYFDRLQVEAQMLRMRYDALRKAGFSPENSLQLCTRRVEA